ncbi:transcriptional regulator [Paenibacillus agaridevorans]|uniref:Transcriptional regulator n=1 Tax=Paenibacillus agaridevorans TaxID=171404 RepID=A0A2R5F4H6_9BACL|nr:transcriptional regulator [Paenibacillus agaridevorans]GBG11061.1 transcriptional regulator [Paenibacillus agaridevorans]
MTKFEERFEEWMQGQIANKDVNPRRRERLELGLGHGTIEFLRTIWFPAVRHFDHLHAEWEVRDFHNGYRYIDLAYTPGDAKGAIEIQGYGPHARDLDVRRFKDLCWRHSLMALDGWTFLPIAYPSIKEETSRCQQLILSFIGLFVAANTTPNMGYLEAETLRYARRLLRPFTPTDLASHLCVSNRHANRILNHLVQLDALDVASGNLRYRAFRLRTD